VGVYRDRILPHLIDRACGTPELIEWRTEVAAGLHGEVLEIGFGSGLNMAAYPAEVTVVYAVEPAEVARRLSEKRVDASPIRVEHIGLDGQSIPLADASCDGALSTFTLCTIPDVEAALAEVRRVLRPGARLHFLEHGLSPDQSVATWQRRIEPMQKRLADGCHLTRDPAELVAAAGFEIERVASRYARGPRPWSWFTEGVARKPTGNVGRMGHIEYDEFGLFSENAAEFGLPFDHSPVVRREAVEVRPGFRLSALVWGDAEPELVLLHGGGQNAHTWDTVAMALGRPLVAIDLPGHGHSDGSIRGALSLDEVAIDVAAVIRQLAPRAQAVVGMSLGGLTTLALSAAAPDLVRRVVLVDVLPSRDDEASAVIGKFINGPASFADFDQLLARTVEFNPTRSESSLRRGILHNAVQQADGSWVWRHARTRDVDPDAPAMAGDEPDADERTAALWALVEQLTVPFLLVRGMAAGSVVRDDHEAELLRRLPGASVAHVEGAGHSVQGDRPIELASLIDEFVPR
jgi:pimeloyl-ACP methyl ester carboxylesterase